MTSKTEFISQFGESLLKPSNGYGSSAPSDELDSKDYIMLYFSAHWCGPCRRFTPKLIEFYKTMKSNGTNMELVFCSLDHDKKDWEEYTSDMPWLCLPFDAPESKKMAHTYKASGIPHLVILGSDRKVITMDGTENVSTDPLGEKFPWKPKSIGEVWPKEILASEKGTMLDSSTLKDKYLMLYFSAHWCPPCKAFTPVLSEAYTKLKATRDDFELVFVSSDRNEAAFKEYFDEMTFCALPFEHRETKSVLSKTFGVTGIPKLIMLGPVSNEETMERPVINDNIRANIESGDFTDFPFVKKNYGSIETADVNDEKAIVVFHEAGDDDEQNKIKDVLKEVAEKMKDETEEKCNFLWSFSSKGMGPMVREALKLPKIPGDDPLMVILDIPDNGGFYKGEPGKVTADSVMDFLKNPGERKQLQ